MRPLNTRQGSLYLIMFLLASCFNPDKYEPSSASANQITFTTYNQIDTVSANGISAAEIRVVISPQTTSSKRVVVFTTTNGFFFGGKGDSLVIQDIDNFTATAKLASVTVGKASVTAKIQGLVAPNTKSVIFTRAFPDGISVTVDSFAVNSNYTGETVLTASLTSNGGKASSGHPVSFSVTQSGNAPVGVFINDKSTVVTGDDGKARIRYSPGIISQAGTATVTASTSTTLIETVNGKSQPVAKTLANYTVIYIRK